MIKLTIEQRIEIYKKRKKGETLSSLSKKYSICITSIKYFVSLIDIHGFDILRKDKNNYYSKDIKQEMINEVLISKQSINSTALKFGLTSSRLLSTWVQKYKDNNYVIIEKSKDRSSIMSKRTKLDKDYEDMTPEEKVKYLEDKNLYLEAENEYLKKLRAVIQKRKDQQQKKK